MIDAMRREVAGKVRAGGLGARPPRRPFARNDHSGPAKPKQLLGRRLFEVKAGRQAVPGKPTRVWGRPDFFAGRLFRLGGPSGREPGFKAVRGDQRPGTDQA